MSDLDITFSETRVSITSFLSALLNAFEPSMLTRTFFDNAFVEYLSSAKSLTDWIICSFDEGALRIAFPASRFVERATFFASSGFFCSGLKTGLVAPVIDCNALNGSSILLRLCCCWVGACFGAYLSKGVNISFLSCILFNLCIFMIERWPGVNTGPWGWIGPSLGPLEASGNNGS